MEISSALRKIWSVVWRRETASLLFITGLLVSIFALFSSLPSQAAQVEVAYAEEVSSFSNILENPLDAPHKIASFIATSITPTVRALRFVSFLYVLAATYAVFYVVRHWHGGKAALLTGIMFSVNAIVLAIGRLGTPQVTLLSWFVFAGMLLWHMHSKSNRVMPFLVVASSGALLYTPGAPWIFLIVCGVYFNRIREFFYGVKRSAVITGTIAALVVMLPLIVSFISDPDLIRQWLLIPQSIELSSAWRSSLAVPSAFLFRMPAEPLINVARLPVLDIASGFLLLIGLYAYARKLKLDRTRVMIGVAIVGMVLGLLGNVIAGVVLLLPFAFSVIGAGIEYLLDVWSQVFPHNPIAIGFASILISLAALGSSYYQLTRFLVVWPQTPETREVYDQPRLLEK